MVASLADAMGKGIGLTNIIGGSSEKFVAKATQQKELARTEITDKIEVQESKSSEMQALQGLLYNIKRTADTLMNDDTSAFTQKKAFVKTTDLGNFADYIKYTTSDDVRVDSTAHNGDTRINIEQIATRSEQIIGGVGGAGFHKTNALAMDGTIRLGFNGQGNIDIDVAADQTLDQVLVNINYALVNDGNAAANADGNTLEAFLVSGDNDTAFIEIRSKKTGGNSDITFSWENSQLNLMTSVNNVNGVGAIVNINGVTRHQNSNEFINVVPGVSFTALKVNSAPNQYNTIEVQEDNTKAQKMIVEFCNVLNELSYFIAKNSKSSRSHLEDKYRDPYAPLESYNSSESPLRGSAVLEEAKLLWSKFTSKQSYKTGEITSIYDVGMGLKSETREDGVTFDSLVFEDEAKFKKMFAENFEGVRALFVTSGKVTPQGGNVGEMKYIPSELSKPIVSSVVSGDLAVAVTYTNGGEVNANNFTITLANGVQVQATNSTYYGNEEKPYYIISFKGTQLEGMDFAVYPRGANAETDNFTVNYNAGIANIIRSDANHMFGEGGFSGSTIDAVKEVSSQKTRLEEELTRVTKELDEMTQKLESQFEKIAMMDVMAAIQIAMVEKMFETS
ncbi:MAG: flagellar filament capping protein FliD [Rickettsiaceae bacterium]|nr:flagellar filament capping protein FliD [Rickettsiaceae bacterium]MDP4832645.1 flagellar filament capping protein FliD [Rickettsiaceae bacterium]